MTPTSKRAEEIAEELISVHEEYHSLTDRNSLKMRFAKALEEYAREAVEKFHKTTKWFPLIRERENRAREEGAAQMRVRLARMEGALAIARDLGEHESKLGPPDCHGPCVVCDAKEALDGK